MGLCLYTMYQFSVVLQGIRVTSTFYIVLGSLIVFSLINVIYHIKSFRFYKRKPRLQLPKKRYKLFWLAGFVFPVFLFSLLSFLLFINMQRYALGYYQSDEIVVIVIFFVVCIVEFLETSALQKRIKRLNESYEANTEIDDIGKLT
ncbi:MAG: hypothetical protein AAF617_13920 [Bacteroidota bacterium]